MWGPHWASKTLKVFKHYASPHGDEVVEAYRCLCLSSFESDLLLMHLMFLCPFYHVSQSCWSERSTVNALSAFISWVSTLSISNPQVDELHGSMVHLWHLPPQKCPSSPEVVGDNVGWGSSPLSSWDPAPHRSCGTGDGDAVSGKQCHFTTLHHLCLPSRNATDNGKVSVERHFTSVTCVCLLLLYHQHPLVLQDNQTQELSLKALLVFDWSVIWVLIL